jgi:hypothetical protein
MAQSPETGNPIMTANPITDLLTAPLGADWTVEELAEQLLRTIAVQSPSAGQEFILDSGTAGNGQIRRVLRPLLACLATKSATEAGTSPDLYGGRLSFRRPDRVGRSVWIVGQFENKPGMVRAAFQLSGSPPQFPENAQGDSVTTP